MAISTTHDIVPDSPTTVFATLNPLAILSGVTVDNGNLTVTTSTNNTRRNVFSSISAPANSGKFYAEFCVTTVGNSDDINVGVSSTVNTAYQNYLGGSSDAYAYWGIGRKISGNSYSSYGSSFSTAGAGGIIGVLIDTDNGDLTFYLNNTSMGTAYTGINFDEYFFGIGRAGDSVNTYQINFGQDPTFGGSKSPSSTYTDANGIGSFYYQPPTGALALCTANLPDPAIDPAVDDLPEDYFNCLTYSGTSSQQDIAVGFKPDLVWVKSRTQTYGHMLYDTVRGQKHLNSDNADAEVSDTQLAFHSTDGFTVSAASGELNDPTGAPNNFVAWCWRAAGSPSGSTSTTGSAKRINTSGTQDDTSCSALATAASTAGASNVITPTLMSINQKAGFSIVKYSGNSTAGATVPTGLSSDVDFFIYKALNDSTYGWNSWHRGLTDDYYIQLNTTTGQNNDAFIWDASGMANNVITHGSWVTGANVTGKNYIIYAWHSVAGYSAFGSYTGNGNTTGTGDGTYASDGPFIFTGFRPSLIILKRTNASGNPWLIIDSTRDSYNACRYNLFPNEPWAESNVISEGGTVDFLSNGFKVRVYGDTLNGSGSTYIYAAFAEQPFKYANAR